MNRLLTSVRWNVLLQFRNGFYFASAFFVLIWLALLSQVPHDERIDLGYVIPAFLLLNLLTVGFYFIAGLVLLEKAEGTLASLVVTPLRAGEYLVAKALSLALLGLIESLLIVLPLYGWRFAPLPLLAGLFAVSGLYSFIGFVAVARFDTMNEFILPSGLLAAAVLLPLLDYFGLFTNPIFYLHPLQPPLLLLHAAFAPVEPWQWAYSVIGSLCWLLVGFGAARRAFYRFVVRTAGS